MTRGARGFVVDSDAGQRRDFEKIGALVEQQLDAFARQQLATLAMALDVLFAAALGGSFELLTQPLDGSGHAFVIGAVSIGLAVDRAADRFHG